MSDEAIKLYIEDLYNIKFDIAKKCFRLANKLATCQDDKSRKLLKDCLNNLDTEMQDIMNRIEVIKGHLEER